MSEERGPGATRRAVLAGTGAAGAVVVLGGCASGGAGSGDPPAAPAPTAPGTTGPAPAGSGQPGATAAAALAQVADIPVGGGKVFDAAGVVVTQPEPGQIKAFSATCTHEGCLVGGVSNGTINCPCHGSRFNVADGSVVSGPARGSLSAVAVTVEGTGIKLG